MTSVAPARPSEDFGIAADDVNIAFVSTQGDGARAGDSCVLVIRGEPGIGKTALVSDALMRATFHTNSEIASRELRIALAKTG